MSIFLHDLTGFVFFATWDYYASEYAPWLPHVGRCAGEPFAAFCGCAILSSYLVLFIMFYIATYRKAVARKGKGGANKKAGVSSMKQSAAKVADSCGSGKHSTLVTEK
jgi:fatty acid elongase 3